MKKLINASQTDGGKAYGLSVLASGGFNIPDGFVIDENDIKNIKDGNTAEFEKYLSVFLKDDTFAVRSSAYGEDGDKNSFAGIFETRLNVKYDLSELTKAVSYVSDSAAGSRVSSYDENNRHAMNIVVQRMVSPLLAGVAFSSAVDENGDDVIRIEAVEGLAEKLVSGRASSSVVTVRKEDILNDDVKINISGKALDYSRMLELAREVFKMEKYFKKAIDTEWCIDKTGEIFFVQARPVTKTLFISDDNSECIVASDGHAQGTVFVIDENWDEHQTAEQIEKLPENAVLVAWATDTRHMPLMKKAAAIITEEGTALSHAAIISRELEIPCITGYKNAMGIFKNGKSILLDTRNQTIRYDGRILNFNRKKLLDFSDIYDFDKISEIKADGKTLLFQPSFNGVIMYLPYGTASSDEEKYEKFARKVFKSRTLRSSVFKYEWYFIYKQFKNLPFFNSLCIKLKKLCKDQNSEKIEKFYTDAEAFLRAETEEKGKYDPYDRVIMEETALSLHLLTDMLVPNGYAVGEVYFKVMSHLVNMDISFEDMISGNFPHDLEETSELIKAGSFIEKVSVLRNEISSKLLSFGAISYDGLYTRNDRMKEGMKYAGIEIGKEDRISELFYETIKYSEKAKLLIDKAGRL